MPPLRLQPLNSKGPSQSRGKRHVDQLAALLAARGSLPGAMGSADQLDAGGREIAGWLEQTLKSPVRRIEQRFDLMSEVVVTRDGTREKPAEADSSPAVSPTERPDDGVAEFGGRSFQHPQKGPPQHHVTHHHMFDDYCDSVYGKTGAKEAPNPPSRTASSWGRDSSSSGGRGGGSSTSQTTASPPARTASSHSEASRTSSGGNVSPSNPLAIDQSRTISDSRARFRRYDVNANGELAVDEIRTMFRHMDLPFDELAFMNIVEQFDIDDSSTLNYEEFCQLCSYLCIGTEEHAEEKKQLETEIDRLEAALPNYQDLLGVHPHVASLMEHCASLVMRQGRVDEADKMVHQASIIRDLLAEKAACTKWKENWQPAQPLQRKWAD